MCICVLYLLSSNKQATKKQNNQSNAYHYYPRELNSIQFTTQHTQTHTTKPQQQTLSFLKHVQLISEQSKLYKMGSRSTYTSKIQLKIKKKIK